MRSQYPLGVAERLPARGARVSLFTDLVVKEDGWALFGFDRVSERQVFRRLLGPAVSGPTGALAAVSVGTDGRFAAFDPVIWWR